MGSQENNRALFGERKVIRIQQGIMGRGSSEYFRALWEGIITKWPSLTEGRGH